MKRTHSASGAIRQPPYQIAGGTAGHPLKSFENRACRNSFILFFVLLGLSIAFFWCFCGPTDGMAYALLFHLAALPAAALGVSAVWGAKGGRWAYALPLALCVSEPLLDFCTFRLTAFFAGHGLAAPYWTYAPLVLASSAAGLGAGRLFRAFRQRKAA